MADEPSTAPKALTKNPLGASGKAVAANVEHLRKAANMTFVGLSEELDRLDRPIPPLGLRKIVAETRRVDSDDLVALAVVFNVSPASLLMPNLSTVEKDDLVHITGWLKPITASVIWRWLMAARPLVRGTGGTYVDRALPSWERQRLLAAMDAAQAAAAEAESAVEAAEAAARRAGVLDGDD